MRAAGRRAEVRQVDLSDLPAAADVVDELADALGGLNAFVNNAGTGSSSLADLSWDDCAPSVPPAA